MNVSIFGLGYVGTVMACCLSRWNHSIIGVDANSLKVDSINDSETPIIEPGIAPLLKEAVTGKKFVATLNASEAIAKTDISLVCVGTPSLKNGSLSLSHVFSVVEQIGQALMAKDRYHIVVVRSTVLPGTVEKAASLIEKISGKMLGKDFGVASNPEFMREGTAIQDFEHPPFTIVGASEERVEKALRQIYQPIQAPFHSLQIREAEFLKYASNVFHAVKITFANELGFFCKKLKIDSHAIMDIFCQDTKLNISPAYLAPGFAFGGSCLPKDIRALAYESRRLDLHLPLLESILTSNELQIQRVVDWIIEKSKKKIGILGLSFKSDTDDLRESPIVKVVETLLGKGHAIAIYDPNVNLSRLIGANRQFIEYTIPHISRLIKQNIHDVLNEAEVIIIGNKNQEFRNAIMEIRPDQTVLDLVRIIDNISAIRGNYEGICW